VINFGTMGNSIEMDEKALRLLGFSISHSGPQSPRAREQLWGRITRGNAGEFWISPESHSDHPIATRVYARSPMWALLLPSMGVLSGHMRSARHSRI
jgi:hypothetical protein